MARKKTSLTGFLSDIVDNTKDLVDDIVDRAKDVERDVRNSVGDAVAYDREDEKPAATTGTRATASAKA
ncbi:hypothetical protein [Pseudonocardia sp. WMMC193]|uniref:hypothetical protein n=1 Tax=Pseudonocardia sp. WMMC193 TaxID=2911965 RepID=UPI001F484A94|nr:hypothetical protein [Pseudonocardia sp. WMMC193]MCF7550743.1 hypothetical protein [Pseudonocardia sp. WMMC193]